MSSVSYNVEVIPGHVWQEGETWTPEKANAIPTINVTGPVFGGGGGAGSVTLSEFASGMFTANAAGLAPFASGWLYAAPNGAGGINLFGAGLFSADAYGRAPFANGWLSLPLVGSGIFTPTTAGRAPFADGFVNAALSQPDAYSYAVGGGTGSAYTATFTPALTSYRDGGGGQLYTTYWDGLKVIFKAPATCAASPTLNVDGLGVKNIYFKDGTALNAGDIVSGSIVEVIYNATFASGGGGWQLLSPKLTTSLAQNGYCRIGNMIIQWGYSVAGGAASRTVTFPIAFPTACLNVQTTVVETDGKRSSGCTGLSTTGFTVWTGEGGVGNEAFDAMWLAIGY